MVCCDTCPYSPTCEEEEDFLATLGLAEWGDPWGEEYPDGDGY